VSGRHRLPSDVVSELMDVLADQPRLVVCDMSGLALSPHTMVEVFAPAQLAFSLQTTHERAERDLDTALRPDCPTP
jgi:hypothetical protein